MQYGFFFDADLCIGCKACVMACRDIHDAPAGVLYRRVTQMVWGHWEKKEGAALPIGIGSDCLSLACHHCENPACLRGCPQAAIQKDESGAVYIEKSLCVSCRRCISNCPYGVISFNPETKRPEKCDLCRSRIMEGRLPACVEACPMRCLTVRPVEELEELFRTDGRVYQMIGQGQSIPHTFIRRNRNRPMGGDFWIRSMLQEV